MHTKYGSCSVTFPKDEEDKKDDDKMDDDKKDDTPAETSKPDGTPQCQTDKEDDPAYKERIVQCSSLTRCFDNQILKLSDDKCSNGERCGKWNKATGGYEDGCIKDKFCG